MTGDFAVWQIVLLSAVFLADIVVFTGLCRDELRTWYAERARRPASREPVVHAGQEAGAH